MSCYRKGDAMNDHTIIKEHAKNFWGASPAGSSLEKKFNKGSKDFFDSVIKQRFETEVPWFATVVNFSRFSKKKVLEVGCGAGYDAFMFCKHGADYTGIDITPENKILTQQHLAYYNFSPQILCMDVEKLSFKEEFDYIFSFGVLHHVPNIEQALKNIYHTLKPQGEFQIIVYNKHSVFYILSTVLTEWILKGGFVYRTLAEQRSYIEHTEHNTQRPLVNVYSKKELRNLLEKAGFSVIKTDIRKLVAGDLPNIRIIGRLYKYIPQIVLDIIGNYAGWYISMRVLKK